jgi:hypothetical protein
VLDAVLDCDEFTADVDSCGVTPMVDAVGGGAHLVGDVTSHCGVVELARGKFSFKVLGNQLSTRFRRTRGPLGSVTQ